MVVVVAIRQPVGAARQPPNRGMHGAPMWNAWPCVLPSCKPCRRCTSPKTSSAPCGWWRRTSCWPWAMHASPPALSVAHPCLQRLRTSSGARGCWDQAFLPWRLPVAWCFRCSRRCGLACCTGACHPALPGRPTLVCSAAASRRFRARARSSPRRLVTKPPSARQTQVAAACCRYSTPPRLLLPMILCGGQTSSRRRIPRSRCAVQPRASTASSTHVTAAARRTARTPRGALPCLATPAHTPPAPRRWRSPGTTVTWTCWGGHSRCQQPPAHQPCRC